MPNRSKFTHDRRERALQVLWAGGSRREAARAISVDHVTMLRWLRRGATAASGGRWRTFFEQVRTAEAGGPELVVLEDRFETMLMSASAMFAWLEEMERQDVPEPITVVEVSFSPAVAGPRPTIDPTERGTP